MGGAEGSFGQLVMGILTGLGIAFIYGAWIGFKAIAKKVKKGNSDIEKIEKN